MAAGKVFTRALAGTACDGCRVVKHRCQLPQAAVMLQALEDAVGEKEKKQKQEDAEEDEGEAKRPEGSVGRPEEPKSFLRFMFDHCLEQ